MSGPLDGVIVLSLAEQFPGPYATLLMADLGADVVMIERPGTGDPARAFPDFFSAIARNKRSVCLDLKTTADLQRFLDLVAKADVVLEGYAPGTAARLKIGYEDLKRINPRLIYASLSGFGQTGPYRDRPAHDISYQAVSGLMYEQAASPGAGPSLPFGDICAAMFAAYSISTALYAREKTGLGTSIDVSMADGLVSWMTPFLATAMNGGTQIDVQHSPAYGSFACKDKRALTLSIAHENHFWRKLCSLLSMEEFAGLDHQQRVLQTELLREKIASRILMKDLVHWSTELDKHKVPWGPVSDIASVCADPHFQSRGLFQQLTTSAGLTEWHVRQPVSFSSYTTSLKRPTPGLGEHTAEVLTESEVNKPSA